MVYVNGDNSLDMKASRKQVQVVAARVGRSYRTIWRWAARGCNLDDPDSVREFLTGNALRQSSNLMRDPVHPTATVESQSATPG
jgi:hypothetical protein